MLTDLFDNANIVRKQCDMLSDIGWEIIMRSNLKDEEVKEYQKQFK